MLERKDEEVSDILEEVIQNHPVLLNRAPTLHRMGIQAFEPVLVDSQRYQAASAGLQGLQRRLRRRPDGGPPAAIDRGPGRGTRLLMSTNNILSPRQRWAPIISPSQDVVMGRYYMTTSLPSGKGDGMKIFTVDEVQLAHLLGVIGTHASITVRLPESRRVKADRGASKAGQVQTTVGRVLFNSMLPDGHCLLQHAAAIQGFGGRDFRLLRNLGRRKTIDLLDTLNRVGFRQSPLSGLSFTTDDLITPPNKSKIIASAESR